MTLLKCKVIANEHAMELLVRNTINPWPEISQLQVAYDELVLFKHFKLEDLYSAPSFFYRQFVRELCVSFNEERSKNVMRPLGLNPRFDLNEQKGLICYFVLPYEKEVRKAALAFLFDAIYNEHAANWIEEVLCNQKYFIMVAQRIS